MEFTVTRKCKGSPETLMDLVADAMKLPEYWHGMREIHDAGNGSYSVRFQFPGKAIMSYRSDRASGICTESYLKGPFTGTKTTEFRMEGDETVLTAKWDIKLSLMLRPMQKKLEKHFTEGSANALRRMCEANSEISKTKQ